MTKGKSLGMSAMLIGILMFLSAIGLTGYNYYSEYSAGKKTDEVISYLESQTTERQPGDEGEIPDYIVNPDMMMPVKTIDGNEYIGRVEVMSLGLDLPVMSEWSYSNFKKAPCRYEGTPYKNNLIIAAHNYRSHFAGLKKLTQGDKIVFTDMDNNTFNYEVMYVEILDRTDVELMSAGEWDLTLFTCTYGGATRVTVRCKSIDNNIV